MRSLRERGEVLLVESVAHSKGAQIFSKNKNQDLNLRKREES
jgi:hypothetical protein